MGILQSGNCSAFWSSAGMAPVLPAGAVCDANANDWISQAANDEAQLLGATAQGQVIFTFNVRDFVALAAHHRHHRRIALAAQHQWTVSALIAALDRMSTETTADERVGQVKWLAHWKPPYRE
jgi:hypothetical protein